MHMPQPPAISGPHPLPAAPQSICWSEHERGAHVGWGGVTTHDARSQIMYSRIFSWAVIGVVPHSCVASAGNEKRLVLLWLVT
jgi:hypothetical protein